MRHNLRVSPVNPRARPGRLAPRVVGLLTALLVLSSLIWGMAPAAQAAEAPVINKPADETSIAGVEITPVKVTGERMEALKAVGLPEGLSLKQESATEGVITGTPAHVGLSEVKLEAEHEGLHETTHFEWTVVEAGPSVTAPPEQVSQAGTEIAPLKVSGERMFKLEIESLPKGLTFELKSETEAVISGTPTQAESPVVTLKATNKEGVEVSTTFKWNVEAEALPAITPPGNQASAAGAAIAPLPIAGERMHELKVEGLPKGLTFELKSETEAVISGTPTHAETAHVTLRATNKEGKEAELAFEWTVAPEGVATISKPLDQASVEKTAIVPLRITGANMAELIAEGLPAGLSIERRSSSEGVISGTPAQTETATVTLKAANPEGAPAEVEFAWRVTPQGPTASGAPAVSPGVVFSAARATCVAAGWHGGTVATQWLLDGAPITGATAATFVAPRSDDGHALACRQTATAAGLSSSLTSAGRMVHEQPPQPSWPISAAKLHCSSTVCMQQGAGPGAVGQAYPQEGAWWGSQQVRCVSAPWTSAVGSSAQPAVRALAEAHAVRISLQRIGAGGTVTVASQELTNLGSAVDALDGSPSPFAGAIVVPFGSQPFAAGELWTSRFPGAAGRANWFAAGGGLALYGVTGTPGVARSFQLTYTLTSADLGARLRCVAGADDGPASAPTTASFASAEYAVATASLCGPRRLGAGSLPQPAIVLAGDPRCVAAPSSLAPLGSTPREVAVKGSRAAVALACGLPGGCRGKLVLSAKRTTLGSAAVHVGKGAERVVSLHLSARGRRALRAAGTRGLAASIAAGTAPACAAPRERAARASRLSRR